MKIEVLEDLTKILDPYEIIVSNGIVSIIRSETKNVQERGLLKTYTDKDIAEDDEAFLEGRRFNRTS